MKKRITAIAIAALASLALLVPAGSAQAAFREDPFCSSDSDPWGNPVTLGSNKMCTSWPLNVNEFEVWWDVVSGGQGQVCLALTNYGGSNHGNPISGIPGWFCMPLANGTTYPPKTKAGPNDWGFSSWKIYRYNPYARYSYRYGQARILNLSSATIRFHGGSALGNWVTHWVP